MAGKRSAKGERWEISPATKKNPYQRKRAVMRYLRGEFFLFFFIKVKCKYFRV
jgi:hypothetical protein